MKIAPLPANEPSRLARLREFDILDTEAEENFDEIVQVASHVCQAPISLISLVDAERQWFKARTGVDAAETPRDHAFCAHVLHERDILEVPDARRDERFHDNPLVTGRPDIRFYAGMPLTLGDGSCLGALCVIDRKPRQLTEGQRACLRTLGKQVVHLLDLRLKVKELKQALRLVEEQKAELQRLHGAGHRLLSIIGHDLRSPMQTLVSLMDLCDNNAMSAGEFRELTHALRTKIVSATDLLDDLLVWAREQFEGRALVPACFPLAALVREEAQAAGALFAAKGNRFRNLIAPELSICADRRALEFMVRNLLLNANKFTEGGEITAGAVRVGGTVRVTVADTGVGLSSEQAGRLFDPAARATTLGTRGEKGSGLGLQMCREFAVKHGGDIGVESSPGRGAKFWFTLKQPA